MTPVVHFQHSILQRKILHTILQFVVEDPTTFVQILIVHTYRQDKVAEHLFRNALSPRHLRFGLERRTDILQIEVPAIIRNVSNRHEGIEEGECFPFRLGHLLVKHCKQIAMWQSCLLGFETALHFGPIGIIGNEVSRLATTGCHQPDKQPG